MFKLDLSTLVRAPGHKIANLMGAGSIAGGRAAFFAALVFAALGSASAAPPDNKALPDKGTATVREQPFGKTSDGVEETLYMLTNSQGCELKLTTYGARIVSLTVPDRDGHLADVVLGFDKLEPYLAHKAYFGCTTGRFANRIAGGKFELEGKTYSLAVNNGPNSLHGGLVGFDRRHWQAKPVKLDGAVGVELSYVSPAGEEGYPGELNVKVVYTWSNDNQLSIEYTATTDKPTVFNLTNHAYWNLGGVADGKPIHGTILDERLMIDADQYVPTDAGGIPAGPPAPVKGTPYDFTLLDLPFSPHVLVPPFSKMHRIGERIDELKKPPSTTKGYDICYVLRDWKPDSKPRLAARVADLKTGRIMEVSTTEPGLQLYCGNFLEGDAASGGFHQHDALCLEAQHLPDSPNRPAFPTTVLKPGQTYHQLTTHRFSAF